MNSKVIFKLQNKVNFVKNTDFLYDYWCIILILPLLGLILEPEMGVITVDQKNPPGTRAQNFTSVPKGLSNHITYRRALQFEELVKPKSPSFLCFHLLKDGVCLTNKI